MKEKEVDDKVKQILEKIIKGYDPEKVYLFGSKVSGGFDGYSDLDIAVIANSSLSFVKRLGESVDIVDEPRVDILIYTPEEFKEMLDKGNDFARNIIAGRLIYEKRG